MPTRDKRVSHQRHEEDRTKSRQRCESSGLNFEEVVKEFAGGEKNVLCNLLETADPWWNNAILWIDMNNYICWLKGLTSCQVTFTIIAQYHKLKMCVRGGVYGVYSTQQPLILDPSNFMSIIAPLWSH